MVYSVKLCFFIFLLEDTVESVPNLPLGSDFSARPAIQIATAHVAFCSESWTCANIYIYISIYLSWLAKRPTSLGYFGFGPVAHAGTVTQSNLSIASGKPSQQNCKHFNSEMNDLQYLDAWMLETLCFHRLMAKHQALTTVDPIPTGYITRLFVGYQFGFVWKKSRCSGLLLITSYHGLSGFIMV